MIRRIEDESISVPDDPEEEKELLEPYEKDELVPVENQEEMRKKLKEAA